MAMDWILGIVLVLGVMILIHEWGHFIAARLCGVRVDVFSIGFGPRLFGWKKGPTDYRVSALPLGGYVRMAGQDPSEIDSEGSTALPGNSKTYAPYPQIQAVAKGLPDELSSKPRWKRALISFAGPAVNLIFPIFLLTGFFVVVGVPYSAYLDQPVQVVGLPPSAGGTSSPLKAGDRILSINGMATPDWDKAYKALSLATSGSTLKVELEENGVRKTVKVPVKDAANAGRVLGYAPIPPTLDQIAAGMPADHAGLREGDTITAIDGAKIISWDQFMDAVRGSNGKTLTLDLARKGATIQVKVAPKMGVSDTGESVYQVGVYRRDKTAYRRVGFATSVRDASYTTGDTIYRTLAVVGELFSGRVSITQLQGPVGISHMASQAVKRGPLDVISLMVLISVNLGILNLLPIPILDGGHILLLAIEGSMRRDLSLNFKERFIQVGLVFLLVVFAIVMYNDIVRRLPIHS